MPGRSRRSRAAPQARKAYHQRRQRRRHDPDPDPPECPTGKTQYRSRTVAQRAIAYWRERGANGTRPIPRRPYLCDVIPPEDPDGPPIPGCGWWHLTRLESWRPKKPPGGGTV